MVPKLGAVAAGDPVTRCFICGSTDPCDHREDTLHFSTGGPAHRVSEGICTELPQSQKPKRLRTPQERARYYLTQAVRRGEIRKPLLCERCGIRPRRLEAHHWDYTKPLAVTWVCHMCHGFVDRLVKSRIGPPVQIFAVLDLERIARILQVEFQSYGYTEVPMEQRFGKLFTISTGPTNTGLRDASDGKIQ